MMIGIQPHLVIRAVVMNKNGKQHVPCLSVSIKALPNEKKVFHLTDPKAKFKTDLKIYFADPQRSPPHIRFTIRHQKLIDWGNPRTGSFETFYVNGYSQTCLLNI